MRDNFHSTRKPGVKKWIVHDVWSAEPLYEVESKWQHIQLEILYAWILGNIIFPQNYFLNKMELDYILNLLEVSRVVKGSLKYFILKKRYYVRKTSKPEITSAIWFGMLREVTWQNH